MSIIVIDINDLKETIFEPHIESLIKISNQGREIDNILAAVSLATKVSIRDIKSSSRKREVVEARNIYIYLANNSEKYSNREIGQLVNRDHSTVNHSVNVVKKKRFEYHDIIMKVYSELKKIYINKSR